ncbi:hypothetical protein QBC32DRAFT_327021 [Pseudoneurospora amorphoporcata]|uniref:Uncharacterized protein n=1 Tax=Pseudoneurospora amorphoporcata TaxID=241081 RepID=A0AAN6NSF4_9PEZI|nr:hypothetical protein QBC32DRAFT_327021 [Pseudoneurospora amorphoporcata]
MGTLTLIYEARWLPASVVLAIWAVLKVKQYYRLCHFKGPFSTGWFEIWHGLAYLSEDSHMKYKEATDKYGPIARVGPNELITTSLELVAHVMNEKQDSGKESHELESSVDVHVTKLVQLIRTKYCSTETKTNPFDLGKKMQYLALDVISHIGFGEPFGDLLSDQYVGGYIEDAE